MIKNNETTIMTYFQFLLSPLNVEHQGVACLFIVQLGMMPFRVATSIKAVKANIEPWSVILGQSQRVRYYDASIDCGSLLWSQSTAYNLLYRQTLWRSEDVSLEDSV